MSCKVGQREVITSQAIVNRDACDFAMLEHSLWQVVETDDVCEESNSEWTHTLCLPKLGPHLDSGLPLLIEDRDACLPHCLSCCDGVEGNTPHLWNGDQALVDKQYLLRVMHDGDGCLEIAPALCTLTRE